MTTSVTNTEPAQWDSTQSLVPTRLPSPRRFGYTMAVVMALLSLFILRKHGHEHELSTMALVSAAALIFGGLALGALAAFAPSRLEALHRAWFALAGLLQRWIEPVLMGFFFFVLLTPIALYRRRFAKPALRLTFDPGAQSYWLKRTPPGPDPATFDRQY
jgi:hypothetical protein